MKPEEKIYQAYFESKKSELYFNQLKELTKLSDSSLVNTLKKLVSNKTLTINKTKSNTYYKIFNPKLIALKYSEIALYRFYDLNRGVRLPLQNLLDKLNNIFCLVILFGSASRKEETKESDIDILIVTNQKFDFSKIKKEIEIISNYPLNVFSCSTQEFIEANDHIVIQAKKTGFPIKGEQYFYEVIINESF